MLIGFIIIIVSLLLDQVTKQLAYRLIAPRFEGINDVVIPHVLELSYYENTGASLGMLSDFQYKDLLFFIITILALVVFGYLFKDSNYKNKKVYTISIALFISGTLGNAIDRAIYGFVIDFLHYPFLDFLNDIRLSNFTNNLADNFLSAAIVLFAIDIFFLEPKRHKKIESETDGKED